MISDQETGEGLPSPEGILGGGIDDEAALQSLSTMFRGREDEIVPGSFGDHAVMIHSVLRKHTWENLVRRHPEYAPYCDCKDSERIQFPSSQPDILLEIGDETIRLAYE